MSKPNLIASALLLIVAAGLSSCGKPEQSSGGAGNSAPPAVAQPAPAPAAPPAVAATNVTPAMEAAQSVVVTHDLDFGPRPTSLEEALREIERRQHPADGTGRTFAILEAFNGALQPDGKMRVSLRISTEKPGSAEVVFRRTGEVLWKSPIVAATHKPSFNAGSLTILFDTGDGKSFTVDGSLNPPSILDAILKEAGLPVAQAWPDGEVRELSFIYSACGCPIKVKCKRAGDRTVRTETATQVIFPDDPAAIQVISRLMRW